MDPISIATGTVGFASLALQLVDTVKRLSALFDHVQDAPNVVMDLMNEAAFLQNVLQASASTQLMKAGSQEPTEVQELKLRALQDCARVVTDLQRLLQKFEPGLKSKSARLKNWVALQVAFSKSDISDIQQRIEYAKSTVLICQQFSMENHM